MNHSTWKTRRTRQLAGEPVEYDQEYVDARLAGDLGQAVYNRRIELGLSQAELAERAGMTQPQISRMEGGDTVPTLPLLRRLAKALDGVLNVAIDEGDSRVTQLDGCSRVTAPRPLPMTSPDLRRGVSAFAGLREEHGRGGDLCDDGRVAFRMLGWRR